MLLRERGLEHGRLEAELLLAGVLGIKRLDLYLQFDRPVTPEELERFRGFVRRRLRREPVQYILGESQFRGLRLRVDRRVLIPRPETEQLVSAVLAFVAGRQGLAALDVGTGSGAIALSFAEEAADVFARIVGTDASPDALAVAIENAEALGLGGRVEFRAGAGWAPLSAGERFDVIVSNPPYVALGESAGLSPDVRDFEPHGALFAGPSGLEVLRELAAGAWSRLRPGGLLALEVGLDQAEAVAGMVSDAGFGDARIRHDLSGRDRIVLAVRGEAARAAERDVSVS
jgi:release factor glutamine methyltransferase